MRRFFHLLTAIPSALLLTGCLDPARLNTSCAWVGDTSSAALDMARAADRRHLANDVRIAGENATRYRDSVKVHFGFDAAGRLDAECLDRLSATIAAQHRVRRADIDAAAAMRDVPLDLVLVYLPIAAVFFLVSRLLSRRFFRGPAPDPDERLMRMLGLAWTGLVASAVAATLAYFLQWNVDSLRLRDFHMSFRAGYLPIGRHPWVAFMVACSVFALASAYESRAARRSAPEAPSRHIR